jgi:HicB-like protein involved in pilus formation
MDLTPYVGSIHEQLDAAAEAGGDDARELAKRLAAPLDAAIRLALQDALSAAAEEITVELAPGSVELRIRGREPQFVVTPPPAAPSDEEQAEPDVAPVPSVEGDDAIARINLRMPEQLKARVEQAAESEGLSVNAWLVRAAAARLERREGPPSRATRTSYGTQRYQGWAR